MQVSDKTLAIETDEAIYFFIVYIYENVVHVKKFIRKNQEGDDKSISLSIAGARELYRQLCSLKERRSLKRSMV
jgi:hypothetical protein